MNVKIKYDTSIDQQDKIKQLTELLNGLGIDLTVKGAYISIDYDKIALRAIQTRGAGRKSILSKYLISEVYAYAQEHTAAESAAYAGVSLRTYQRQVAKYKAFGWWREDGQDMLYFGQ